MQGQGINRAFKVTCATYRKDSYQYHSSFKKALGEYYEIDVSYWAGIVTFVYKRTFHSSPGLSIASEKVLKKLKNCKPEAIITLTHEGSAVPDTSKAPELIDISMVSIK